MLSAVPPSCGRPPGWRSESPPLPTGTGTGASRLESRAGPAEATPARSTHASLVQDFHGARTAAVTARRRACRLRTGRQVPRLTCTAFFCFSCLPNALTSFGCFMHIPCDCTERPARDATRARPGLEGSPRPRAAAAASCLWFRCSRGVTVWPPRRGGTRAGAAAAKRSAREQCHTGAGRTRGSV